MRIIDCDDFSFFLFLNLFIMYNVSLCRKSAPFKKG